MSNQILEDIVIRCNSEFYIGVVGPVRSGKSTFITKFMETKILPYVKDEFHKNKILDELPQSSGGKTIMTVEPKFIPNNAISVDIGNDVKMNLRLVDSVGYVINGASGHEVDNEPRLVKTPWFVDPIPFTEAAHIGTKKVITNHSNIGIVITSDGSFGEFKANDYLESTEEIITELIELKKPFVVVVNTADKSSNAVNELLKYYQEKYQISTTAVNANNLNEEDINEILTLALNEFEIKEISLNLPGYINALDERYEIKANIDVAINSAMSKAKRFKDIALVKEELLASNLFSEVKTDLVEAKNSTAVFTLEVPEECFKKILCELLGTEEINKETLIKCLYEYRQAFDEYKKVSDALRMVKETGYGISMPSISDMTLLKPEITSKQGRYGVKLCAKAPSIHMIKVEVESSFEPLIGSLEQSKMIIDSLSGEDSSAVIWDKEIFGRKICEVVNDGIRAKLNMLPAKAQIKLKDTLEKVVNYGNGGLIAIIL